MPRHARVRIAKCPWHVIQRGVNRSRCFVDDADRQLYLNLLKVYSRRHECAVHAYVLMTNHVHLLVSPEDDDGLSRMMKALGERYVPYFNRLHGRTGTLWEGRFRSSVVQSERYLLICQRYIELNPVRAELVPHAGDYPWSSYSANAVGAASDLVTPHELYLRLGRDQKARADAYRKLFGPPSESDIKLIRESASGGNALATEEFARVLETQTEIPVWPRKRGRQRGCRIRNESGAVVPPRGKKESVPI